MRAADGSWYAPAVYRVRKLPSPNGIRFDVYLLPLDSDEEESPMSVRDKLEPNGPTKLLALDGGGIRGVLTIEILARIEALLRDHLGAGEDFVLADYFDYVAGTSTGAIIATCVSLGLPVSDIRDMYLESGREMFQKTGLLERLRYKYTDDRLSRKLRAIIGSEEDGSEVTLGSSKVRTLLMLVLKNLTTDSPWTLSNNPRAKYNRPERRRDPGDCNLDLPLWKLVRASTAAPVYFPPEKVTLGPREFIFIDGGITTYNNPAFQLFVMATAEPYRLEWPTGEDQMLLVSVGTGASPNADANLRTSKLHLLHYARRIPSDLMYAALNEQDLLCRIFGRCVAGSSIDREVEDLKGAAGPTDGKLFTYARYNVALTKEGLAELGLEHVRPEDVAGLDSVDAIPQLQEIGRRVADRVRPDHLRGFLR